MTVYERALELIQEGMTVGLGSGKASTEFIKCLGEKVKSGFQIRGVPTSQASDDLAQQLGIPLITLEEAIQDGAMIDMTIDGADEVDPQLNMVKGWGRALIREKVVASASKKLIILIGDGKMVAKLGTRGKLPVEVVPFSLAFCSGRIRQMGWDPVLWTKNGEMALTDNGNPLLDCVLPPLDDPYRTEQELLAIPGVVGTGLFLDMADLVLEGDAEFKLIEERARS